MDSHQTICLLFFLAFFYWLPPDRLLKIYFLFWLGARWLSFCNNLIFFCLTWLFCKFWIQWGCVSLSGGTELRPFPPPPQVLMMDGWNVNKQRSLSPLSDVFRASQIRLIWASIRVRIDLTAFMLAAGHKTFDISSSSRLEWGVVISNTRINLSVAIHLHGGIHLKGGCCCCFL